MQITQTTHERLVDMLGALKLTAVRDQLDRLLGEAARQELTLPDALAMLCERELGRKHERRIEMGLSIAKFPASWRSHAAYGRASSAHSTTSWRSAPPARRAAVIG